LQKDNDEIKKAGLNVVSLSYDSKKILSKFGQQQSIQYTMLADKGSKVITKIGVLNPGGKPGSKKAGLAKPITIIVNTDGTVASKIYGTTRVRHTTEKLIKEWGAKKPAAAAASKDGSSEKKEGSSEKKEGSDKKPAASSTKEPAASAKKEPAASSSK